MEALLEMDDYEKPIKLHLVNKYDILSLRVQKRSEHYFKKVKSYDDKGLLFSNWEDQEFISSEKILNDFSFNE